MRVPPRLPVGWEKALRDAIEPRLGDGVAIEVLGSGLDCWAVLVDGGVVLRIPQHGDGAASVERQHTVLEALGERLPVPIPAPLFTVPNPLGPGRIGAYRHVAGDALDEDEWHRRGLLDDANASTVAAIVDAIAAFPADEAVALGVPVDDERTDLAGELAVIDQLVVPRLDAATSRDLVRRWERHLADDRCFAYEPGLVHGDLSLDHLLISGGRIAGLIDFGDITVTDPDLELGYLWAEAGRDFVTRVQVDRGRSVDDLLAAKLDFFQVRDEAADVRWAVEYGLDDLLETAITAITDTLSRLATR